MAGSYEDYKTYINDLYNTIVKKTQTVNYDTRSPGQLKAMLQGYMKPGLDKSIAQREQSGRANNASVDSDAAARGMGGSTWLTDMKHRQNNAVASDVAGLRNDYNTNLYNALLGKIAEQDSMKFQADQYNASAKNKALDRAFAAANANASSWARSSGGGRKTTTTDNGDPFLTTAWVTPGGNFNFTSPTFQTKPGTANGAARVGSVVGNAMKTPEGQNKLRKAIFGV